MFLRPAAADYPAHYEKYISLVPGDLPVFLEAQTLEFSQLFSGLSEERSLFRYAPGKWSIRELVGHLCDSERIFAYRVLCVARGETASLPGFDEDAYVAAGAFDQRSWASLVEEFRTVRLATLSLINTLEAPALLRIGTANGKQVNTTALAHVQAGHAQHHLNILRERYLQAQA